MMPLFDEQLEQDYDLEQWYVRWHDQQLSA